MPVGVRSTESRGWIRTLHQRVDLINKNLEINSAIEVKRERLVRGKIELTSIDCRRHALMVICMLCTPSGRRNLIMLFPSRR